MQNKALILLALALALITVYQQGQLKQLRNDYKTLNSQSLDLLNRLRDLEAENEQFDGQLEQINARIGYMDSKVAKVIDKRAANERLQPRGTLEGDPSDDTDENPPEKQEGGILDTLQQLFH
jgi:peptidoglycan hydrolase CwlO-like protein